MTVQYQIPPDVEAINTLLSAYTHQPRSAEDVERAERLLNQMRQWHANGFLKQGPDVISYTIVMDGWAKIPRNRRASLRAHHLLEQMKEL